MSDQFYFCTSLLISDLQISRHVSTVLVKTVYAGEGTAEKQ